MSDEALADVRERLRLARFPDQLADVPWVYWRMAEEQLNPTANVQHWSLVQRGGHFAAMENPQALAEDIRAFFRPVRDDSMMRRWRRRTWRKSRS